MLPGLPEHVVPTLLARVCRMPPPAPSGSSGSATPAASPDSSRRAPEETPPTHPTDPAVANAVLVGVLLHRLGRDPDTLRDAERRDA
jgi:hypothetical protein